jgi:STAND-like protein
MSGPSGSSRLQPQLQGLVDAALEDYKQQTSIDLANHTLAGRLQDCKSVEDVTAVLREQAQDFKKFREKDKVLKPLQKVLTILQIVSSVPLSSIPRIGHHVHPVRPKVLTDVQCL